MARDQQAQSPSVAAVYNENSWSVRTSSIIIEPVVINYTC